MIVAALSLLPGCPGNEEQDNRLGEDGYPCGEVTWESVSWDHVLEDGSTPAELLGTVEGECSAPMTWDAFNSDCDIVPATGETSMAVTVTLDHTQVRLGHYENPDTERMADEEVECAAFLLEVPARIHLETADGMFVETTDTLLMGYAGATGSPVLSFEKELGEQGGALQIDPDDATSVLLRYRLGGATAACAGNVELTTSHSEGDGISSTGSGELGSWSATSCPLGETEVDVTAILPDGTTVVERVAEYWDAAVYTGTWTNGGEADLLLHVAAAADTACRMDGGYGASLPATITYSTSDGVIAETVVAGELSVTFDEAGNVRGMSVDLNDELVCTSAEDTIPYGDCATLTAATIQLRVHETPEGTSFTDEGLWIYEYHTGSTSTDREPDAVVGLEFPIGG